MEDAHIKKKISKEEGLWGGLINLDGVRTASLEIPESERISRFIALRDQLFRKVADVTLKVMLILLALLILGLLVGIV
ncbi:MAG: hypothetical protein EB012_13200 [Gammaproteobacteria bacterium]|nr:hypothetical protein [Gammaproteobacteria bacterium]